MRDTCTFLSGWPLFVAFFYLLNPDDLIWDGVPYLGWVDDAVMMAAGVFQLAEDVDAEDTPVGDAREDRAWYFGHVAGASLMAGFLCRVDARLLGPLMIGAVAAQWFVRHRPTRRESCSNNSCS